MKKTLAILLVLIMAIGTFAMGANAYMPPPPSPQLYDGTSIAAQALSAAAAAEAIEANNIAVSVKRDIDDIYQKDYNEALKNYRMAGGTAVTDDLKALQNKRDANTEIFNNAGTKHGYSDVAGAEAHIEAEKAARKAAENDLKADQDGLAAEKAYLASLESQLATGKAYLNQMKAAGWDNSGHANYPDYLAQQTLCDTTLPGQIASSKNSVNEWQGWVNGDNEKIAKCNDHIAESTKAIAAYKENDGATGLKEKCRWLYYAQECYNILRDEITRYNGYIADAAMWKQISKYWSDLAYALANPGTPTPVYPVKNPSAIGELPELPPIYPTTPAPTTPAPTTDPNFVVLTPQTIWAKNAATLRGSASVNGANWGQVAFNTALTLCAKTKDALGNVWYMVKTPDGRSGLLIGNDVSFQAITAPAVTTLYARNNFILRSQANNSSLNWGVVVKGGALILCTQAVDSVGNVWYMVKTSDGRSGWVIGNDVSFQLIAA